MLQNISASELILGIVLLLPLVSFILSFLIPERYSWLASISASVIMFVCTVLGLVLFFSDEIILIETTWFKIGAVEIDFCLTLNATSRLMVLVVTIVSFLVHLYSTGYMAGDSGLRRYFAMLGFFTFSMLGVVLARHLILLFMFWELVGFSSYMLIAHWIEKPAAAKAAQKAFLFNRIGDAFFLIGILMLLARPTVMLADSKSLTLAGLCMFGGIIAKSAQLPLFSWLPDAMEGPTPVSALLHAATMVAAGIFLLIRLFPFFTDTTLTVIASTGAVTAVFAAFCALNQFDIKKILAYSTISQLGLMVTAIGIGAKDSALLHLFTHAFFKAGLFLAAGSVIHALSHAQFRNDNNLDVQDIRNLGGLRKKLPFTFIAFCMTGASLAGVPFFSGFLSKDSILTAAWNINNTSFKWILVCTLLAVSCLTVLYTFRMIRFVFLGPDSKAAVYESPWVMRLPMIALAVASCWIVVSFNPFNTAGWFTKIFEIPEHSGLITIISGTVVLLSFLTAWLIYSRQTIPKSLELIRNGFGMDSFYQKTFGVLILKFASITETTDRKWIDGVIHFTAYAHVVFAHGIAWFDRNIIDGSVSATAWLTKSFGSFTRSFQGGKIQLYILWAAAGLIIFLFFALI